MSSWVEIKHSLMMESREMNSETDGYGRRTRTMEEIENLKRSIGQNT